MSDKFEDNNNNDVDFNNNMSEPPTSSSSKKTKVLFSKKEIKAILIITSILSTITISLELFIYNGAAAKPIIYLYPNSETEVSVELGKPNNITCSYPKYENGWNVLAKPNGDLVDLETGRNLYSLYWEGKRFGKQEITEGFCIKGEDSAKFLEEKLAILGLSDTEAEEFIVYWLPKFESNKYNLIYFENMDEINNYMPLTISPTPDSLIRVMMRFKGVNKFVSIPEQKLITPERTGFVAVEWGGTEIK